MGPCQHEAPEPRLRQSYTAVDDDQQPPDWFVGIVERRHRGIVERWAYGVRVEELGPNEVTR